MRFVRRAVTVFVFALGVASPAVAQQAKTYGQMEISKYDELRAEETQGKPQRIFQGYMLGLLAGLEWTLRDRQEQGLELKFCPPDGTVLSVVDLHATIQEFKNNPKEWRLRPGLPVGWAAVSGYRQRFPCPAKLSGKAPGKQVAGDMLTVGEFNAHYKRLLRIIYVEPREILGGFAFGFLDGVDAVQVEVTKKTICLPLTGDLVTDTISAVKYELDSRREYWADKQDQPVGQAAIIAVKKRYPCGK